MTEANLHSNTPHMHVASILLQEQSMMGRGSGAWGNMSEREENGGKGRMGLAVVLHQSI